METVEIEVEGRSKNFEDLLREDLQTKHMKENQTKKLCATARKELSKSYLQRNPNKRAE